MTRVGVNELKAQEETEDRIMATTQHINGALEVSKGILNGMAIRERKVAIICWSIFVVLVLGIIISAVAFFAIPEATSKVETKGASLSGSINNPLSSMDFETLSLELPREVTKEVNELLGLNIIPYVPVSL
eukprot:gnl/Chilomastix_caulleri/2053.p1 GENE.gnl/Chilomastix_caulleri/2053~~gnl/Chilomastix_caulleri/2053.p1  ORF type:complete len:131 (+),score=25.94 gnl/Chilomastix_caulleri/2053:463-855(+)